MVFFRGEWEGKGGRRERDNGKGERSRRETKREVHFG